MRRLAALFLFAALLLLAPYTQWVHGQTISDTDSAEHTRGITVSGSGEVRAKPNMIEVQLRSAAKAELTGDAIVKYRDAKKRTLSAFTGLKIENIEIEEEGLSITPGNAAEMMQMMWRGMANTASKTQIELASTLTVRLKGIDTLTPEEMTETIGKILDVAQDSGATVGPSQEEAAMARWNGRMQHGGIVKFVLNDIAEIREKAYAKAAEDARTRATRQAKLFGVELGDIVNVQEVFVSGDNNNSSRQFNPWYYDGSSDNNEKASRITSDSLTEIPFRVKLLVRFGIRPAAAKAGAD
jgi:uncharacterized protein YggE